MEDKILKHYGILRRSGRYPWGSGKDPYQRSISFLNTLSSMRKDGMSDTEISKALGIKTTDLRAINSIARAKKRASDASLALRLKDKGMSNVAIGKRMGINESSVRSLLDPVLKERGDKTAATAEFLKKTIANKGPVDIGVGVETGMGISRTRLKTAAAMLKDEGYQIMYIKQEQLGAPGKYTSIMVLAPPGSEYKDVAQNKHKIATITEKSFDDGRTYLGLNPIQNIDGKRVLVRYSDDGGSAKDGIIELRKGVDDLDLGNSRYAQVRIAVDGDKYLKGMAIYSDDVPTGADVVYYTSKKSTGNDRDVFKDMKVDSTTGKIDADNPFGATIKREGQRGALNIVYEEGDWDTWSRNLSSQVLSKQSPALAKKQLGLTKALKQEEFDEIMSLTNPVIKKRLLESLADSADASAETLKAASLPRQSNHVILPITKLKPNEVYAPMFNNGEEIILLRHPHGGVFEIPEVIVNNRNKSAKSILGDSSDAIGIHPSVANKLSGADFDGDTVIAIPNKSGAIKTAPSIESLKNFNPRESYPAHPGMKPMTKKGKQQQMGDVSNLITDMTIKGATPDEIARAVKHSMVVIDAEKHKLNYRQSAIDNGIADLKTKYQGGPKSGASTVISKASSEERVPHRVEGEYRVTKSGSKKKFYVDPVTGEKLYTPTGETYTVTRTSKSGKVTTTVVDRTTKTTKMAKAKSAFELSSGTVMETVYAEHADSMKALANRARLEASKTPNLKYSKAANKKYAKAVDSLDAALRLIERNKPLERKAQLVADHIYRSKLAANKNLDKDDKKRLRGQALTEARHRVGAKKPEIKISDFEWEAIQMGAISNNKLTKIIQGADEKKLKERATPRTAYKMTPTKLSRAKAMKGMGYTPAEIASAIGVSTTTIVDALNG